MTERPPLPDNLVDDLNARRGGFNELMGLRFLSASYEGVRGEVDVGPHLTQPYGLVHGGVYTAMVETFASVGAALNARADGRTAVGLENNTSFVRAVRAGTLHGVATPLSRGRRTQVWEVRITDDDDRLVAQGRVRMICLEGGAQVAGETVAMKS